MMLVLLVLCSGFLQCTLANRLREFHFNENCPKDKEIISEASAYCKRQNMSLVTLYDEGDAKFTPSFRGEYLFWLGLRQHEHNISSWSNNETIIFNQSNITQSDNQTCVAINNNLWMNKDCSERLAFMCYKGNRSHKISYTLIKNLRNWCQARQFCRRHYTDLVSINSTEQNEDVKKEGHGHTFWIGLIHDQWEWEDGGCSAFRNWYMYNSNYRFTVLNYEHKINRRSNESPSYTLCSKGGVRIIRKHEPSTWEEAFDYCKRHHTGLLWIEDQHDQKAVEKWLHHPISTDHFWIGLRQSRVFGFWIWTSDRTVSMNNWENGTQPKQPLSYQCGAISAKTAKWTDKNCLLRLPFLCEEDISFMNP